MVITIPLDGKRGKKFRLCISQDHAKDGGRVFYRLQEYRKSVKYDMVWAEVASGLEEADCTTSRILAGWLTTKKL